MTALVRCVNVCMWVLFCVAIITGLVACWYSGGPVSVVAGRMTFVLAAAIPGVVFVCGLTLCIEAVERMVRK